MHASRIHSLDNLRWAVVWLMVVFHAAMCYMAYAPEWWYVVDKAQPLFSATSYGVYYLHQPILFPLAWLFTAIPLASPLKFLAVSTLALLLCFALSRFVLNAIPPLRRCFRS